MQTASSTSFATLGRTLINPFKAGVSRIAARKPSGTARDGPSGAAGRIGPSCRELTLNTGCGLARSFSGFCFFHSSPCRRRRSLSSSRRWVAWAGSSRRPDNSSAICATSSGNSGAADSIASQITLSLSRKIHALRDQPLCLFTQLKREQARFAPPRHLDRHGSEPEGAHLGAENQGMLCDIRRMTAQNTKNGDPVEGLRDSKPGFRLLGPFRIAEQTQPPVRERSNVKQPLQETVQNLAVIGDEIRPHLLKQNFRVRGEQQPIQKQI